MLIVTREGWLPVQAAGLPAALVTPVYLHKYDTLALIPAGFRISGSIDMSLGRLKVWQILPKGTRQPQ
ncbi:hypothetical protein OG462_43950 [Streptomyces sp. NBC_01077]|uniref:hypothetical protein n=1 Tax=Streptomyces sp. NBC_01077 TaxID=2903746 RepID=UPI003868AC75|nr:hypothetical protein OG462_01055 [Streptomyces sp. NBC_01077]WSV43688.1 hypothetical protein OG462_43950 [Streptomyces sp. NBC_01077]